MRANELIQLLKDGGLSRYSSLYADLDHATARMIEAYIDYLVRHNPEDFKQIPFIGKGYHNVNAKW